MRASVLLCVCLCARVRQRKFLVETEASTLIANPQEMQFVGGLEALMRLILAELLVSSELGEAPGKHQMTRKMSKKQGNEWHLHNEHKSKAMSATHQFEGRNSILWSGAVVGILRASVSRFVFWPESLHILTTCWLQVIGEIELQSSHPLYVVSLVQRVVPLRQKQCHQQMSYSLEQPVEYLLCTSLSNVGF